MIKVTYEVDDEYIERECETCLEAHSLEDTLSSYPDVKNIQVIYD